MTKRKANLLILLTALIYGSYFVVLKISSDMGFNPAFIMFMRGFIFTVAALIFLGKGIKTLNRKDLLVGSIIGSLNFLGYLFQAFGSKYGSPSNNAFITCLNTVFVPLFAWLIYKTKPSKKCFVSLPLALLGMAVLSNMFGSSFSLQAGDAYSLACAIVFGVVIVLLGNMAKQIDFKKLLLFMALYQMVGGFTLFGIQDHFVLPAFNLMQAILVFIYLGLVSTFIATAIQIYAQRFTSETSTVMILVLESVFACILSIVFGFDKFNIILLLGGSLIIAAVLFLIFDFSKLKKQKENIFK